MKKYLLALLLCLITACAKAPTQTTLPPEDTSVPWDKMTALTPESPWRIQFSMRFGEEGDTRRVTGLLWSNAQTPLRLDVMAGAGATVAKISDREEEFLVFVPQEGKAYYHEGATKPFFNFGTPLPLTLGQLAGLLSGRYAEVFGKTPVSATADDELTEYELRTPPGGTVTLDAAGLPMLWKLSTWKLQFTYGEEWPTLPKSLRLENQEGKFALILVKEREKVDEPFTEDQLELVLPPGTPRLPVGKFKN